MALFVGTSGWAYKEWRGGFYPEGLPERRFLEHYASVLSACEINATFHRLHSPQAVAHWAQATPREFRFAVKVHRRLTHARRIAATPTWGPFVERCLESIEPLTGRLGCLLVQFPPITERDDQGLDRLFSAIPKRFRVAFEFRHESWLSPEVFERVASVGATACFADWHGDAPERLPPGPFAYVRLRADRYSTDQRERWRELLEREGASRDVYAFAKHEGVPAGDPFKGVGLAEWLAANTAGAVGPANPESG